MWCPKLLKPCYAGLGHMIDTALAHEKITKDDIPKGSFELFNFVRLDADRVSKLYPHELSGGMKQRTVFAMSLLLRPKLLILDKPTSALDVLTQKYFLKLHSRKETWKKAAELLELVGLMPPDDLFEEAPLEAERSTDAEDGYREGHIRQRQILRGG